MITAAAPASVAFLRLHGKAAGAAFDERDLAGMAPAFVNGEQPSVDVDRPRLDDILRRDDVRGHVGVAERRAEGRGAELIPAGDAPRAVDPDDGLPKESTFGTPACHARPSSTTRPKLVAEPTRCALVICGQNRP